MIPFSYAVVDDEGEVIRKYRWSVKEAKWFTENNPVIMAAIMKAMTNVDIMSDSDRSFQWLADI